MRPFVASESTSHWNPDIYCIWWHPGIYFWIYKKPIIESKDSSRKPGIIKGFLHKVSKAPLGGPHA